MKKGTNYPAETRKCLNCGIGFKFRPWPCDIKRGRGLFCSRRCKLSVPMIDRFFAKVGRKQESGCILWGGSTDRKGYGQIHEHHGGKRWFAHRASYLFCVGEIPDGLLVLHRCDNPPCINPTHLLLGTVGDNNRDCVSKNRHRWRKESA